MSNYIETKKQLDEIRSNYTCNGDIIFTSAMQAVIEHGQMVFKDDEVFNKWIADVDERHDKANAEGKWLFMTRDFEKAILECAKDIAEVNTYDLMVYIQKEMYLSNGLINGEPHYQRAIEIIKGCLDYIELDIDCNDELTYKKECFLDTFDDIGLTDSEIEYFGYGYLIDNDEEEE